MCPSGPIVVTYDDCKSDGSHPAIMGFLLAGHSRELASKTREERQRLICQQYAEVFRSKEALEPLGYMEKNWAAEEFSGGCYVGFMTPSTMTQLSHVMRRPLGPVHFAGTEMATEWCGYMDGAIQTGEKAAYDVQLKLCEATEGRIPRPEPPAHPEPEAPEAPAKPFPTLGIEPYLPSVPGFLVAMLSILVGAVGILMAKL